MILNQLPWLKRQLWRIWDALTAPSYALTSALDQHRARLLAAIAFFSALLLVFNKILRLAINNPEIPLTQLVTTIIIAWLLIAYGLSRTRRYILAAFIAVVPLSLLIIVQGFVRATTDPNGLTYAIIWLVPILMVANFVFSLRSLVYLVVADVLVILALPFILSILRPDIVLADTHFPYDLLAIVVMLILISGFLSERYSRQIAAQSQALVESEERYRGLFEAGFVGIVVHEDNYIVEVNTGFLDTLGYGPLEVLGRPVYTFLSPDTNSQGRKPASKDANRFEMRARRKDNTEFRVEVYRKPVTYRGRPAEVLAFHDITENKLAEESRVQLLAERERSKVLREFISDASHDLRTPLTTINTSLYLLRKTMPDTPQLARHVNSLEAQAVHLHEVLESLLLMAKLDDPLTFFELSMVDLNLVAARVLEASQSAAQGKNQTLTLISQTDLPTVRGDMDEIKRAVQLIVDNALQFTPEGGTITLSTLLAEGYAVIEIQDNGPGIPPEDLPHIFQRFYRGDKARQQIQHIGAGLGLPIARKIVETHGGLIDVTTRLGAGTTFRIDLPIAPTSQETSAVPSTN